MDEITRAADTIRAAGRIVVLTGAGVSAESGVPTFRGGGGAGVWRGMPFEKLSSAEMVDSDLPLVWEWFDYRRTVLSNCKPNRGHTALAQAERSGKFTSFCLVTQNIDNLHKDAGSANVVELHGNIHQARCRSCSHLAPLTELIAKRPPVCPGCADNMRPNVVLFGEMLQSKVIGAALRAAGECDVCLVVGTSALVSPANLIPRHSKDRGAVLIEVNPEETTLTQLADISIRGFSANVLQKIF